MNEEQKQVSKSDAADYVKTLGRDGAYLEIDVSGLDDYVMSVLNSKIKSPSMMVLKSARFDISDPGIIDKLRWAYETFLHLAEVSSLDAKQKSFMFFKAALEAGILKLAEQTAKPMVKYGG